MKKINFIIPVVLAAGTQLSMAAGSVAVTVGGVSYKVTAQASDYMSISSNLQNSLIFGDSALAQGLATAIGSSLRLNGGNPIFNYAYDPTGDRYAPNGYALGWNFLQDENTVVDRRYVATSSAYWAFVAYAPSAADTLNSLSPNALALRNAFNLQSNNNAQGLNYDCTLFDAKNICASFTGTRSTQNGSNVEATTGTFVIAHRPTADVRFGGYINQNLSTSNQGGLRLERSTPGLGAFVHYSLASGLNVRGSIAYGKMDMETTREAIDTAEAGVGNSNIKTQGVQIELNKAYDIKPGWAAIPYGGLRKISTKRAGYTETASDTVAAPLTYAELQQTQTTAFGGVRFLGNIAPRTQLLLSAGVEHDMSTKIDDYAATGIDGLSSISMQGNVKKTRPVLNAALSYDIAKNEKASIGVHHRQEAFDSKAITTIGLTYMKSF